MNADGETTAVTVSTRTDDDDDSNDDKCTAASRKDVITHYRR